MSYNCHALLLHHTPSCGCSGQMKVILFSDFVPLYKKSDLQVLLYFTLFHQVSNKKKNLTPLPILSFNLILTIGFCQICLLMRVEPQTGVEQPLRLFN